jgi:hypothetical protein
VTEVYREQDHTCLETECPGVDLGSKVELASDAELCSAQKVAPLGAGRRCAEGKMGRDDAGNGRKRAAAARRTGGGGDGGAQRMLACAWTPLGSTAATLAMY